MSAPTAPQRQDVVFLHHSVGRNLIEQGGLRHLLASSGFELYDQGYNVDGLHLPDGTRADYDYYVPDDNTDPDGLANIFSQPVDIASINAAGIPPNTLTGLLRHYVIMFKSCYPVTLIESDADLARYKEYYLQIRATMDRYPDHVFLALTPPPLDPGSTNPEAAARARAFANWMKSPAFQDGHPNLFVFDLFNLLAEPDSHRLDHNMLRADYRADGWGFKARVGRAMLPLINFVGVSDRMPYLWALGESHPNARANEAIAPILADAVATATRTYASSGFAVTPPQ